MYHRVLLQPVFILDSVSTSRAYSRLPLRFRDAASLFPLRNQMLIAGLVK